MAKKKQALIENSQSQNGGLTSLIDGSTSNWRSSALSGMVMNDTVELAPYGFQSGHAILNTGVGNHPILTYLGQTGSIHSYRISYEFMITPVWESLTDLQNEVRPSFFSNTECVTDSINIKFFPESNNPNIIV